MMNKTSFMGTSTIIPTSLSNGFTLGDLTDFLNKMQEDQNNAPKRDFIVMTRTAGRDAFHLEMQRQAIRYQLEYAMEQGLISEDEQKRLNEMIESPDTGNMEVAEAIIDAKIKLSNGSNI